MTGQVKEDIISRFFELGVMVNDGCLQINPTILKSGEFLQPSYENEFPHLSFTYCSIPFVYQIDGEKGIEMINKSSEMEFTTEYTLNRSQSQRIFERNESIKCIVVHFMEFNSL